jgi:hypothetical protein
MAWWVAQMALQLISATILTSYTYFFVDDWLFTEQAHTQPFGLSYLREPLFEHFSPVTRLLDKLLVAIAPGSFAFAHAVQLAMYGLAVAAFAWVVRMILGNSWRAFALTLLFGQSLFLMRLLNWWTATANILPSTICMLVAIGAYLRWREIHSRRWLAVMLGAFAAALLDYELALLFPVYIALISLVLLGDEAGPRAWLAAAWRERWGWAGLSILEGLALVNFYSSYYFPMAHPGAGQMIRYMELALIEGFLPALVGIKDPQAAVAQYPAVIAGCVVALLALAGLWIYTRRRAGRCMAAFAAVFVITMLPVGYNRIRLWGVASGQEFYYQQSVQFMFLVLVALAIAGGGRRRSLPSPLAAIAVRLRAAPRTLGLLAAVGVAGYAVLLVTSVHAMAGASPEPTRSRAFVDAFHASVRTALHTTGDYPVLINHPLPARINGFAPFDHYDYFVPIIDPRIRFDEAGAPTYGISSSGRIVRVRFDRLATGAPGCAAGGPRGSMIRVPLSSAPDLTPGPSVFTYALRMTVRTPTAAGIPVALANSGGVSPDLSYPEAYGAGVHTRFVPLSISTRVAAVDLGLPAGACVTDLSLGAFHASGPPL